MRMIDADKMLERLKVWNTSDNTDKALYNFAWNRIAEQPTAYDIDNVIEQLEETSVTYCREYGYAEDENILYLPDAIEIVKKGGEQE